MGTLFTEFQRNEATFHKIFFEFSSVIAIRLAFVSSAAVAQRADEVRKSCGRGRISTRGCAASCAVAVRVG